MLDYEFDIIHLSDVNHQAADALTRLKTKGEHETPLEDEVSFLIILQEIYACSSKMETTDLHFIE